MQYHVGTAQPARDDPVARVGAPPGGASVLVLGLQRAIGNAAVARAVQRTQDFRIGGRVNNPGDTDNIAFRQGHVTLPMGEEPKIPRIVTSHGAGSTLFIDGYCSEDENPGLALRRANAVSALLGSASPRHSGPRTTRDQSALGRGRIEYRELRKVEIIANAVHAPPPAANQPANIDRPCGAAFAPAQTRARDLLDHAITELGAPSAATTGLLTRLFGAGAAVHRVTIVANLTATRNHIVSNMDPAPPPPGARQVVCHTDLDGRCPNSPAYNVGQGPAAVMTLCPGFLDNPGDVEGNARTLIHEGTHGTAGFAAVDKAYGHTRLVNALSTADALRNTDSYVLLVMNITNNLGHTGPAPIGVAGDVLAGMTPDEERKAAEALAHLEKWLTQAYQDMSSTYDTVNASVAPGAWTGATAVFDRQTFALLAPHFGLTDVGLGPAFNPPTQRDQQRLAAIHDRYLAMRSVMWGRGITTRKVAGGAGSWRRGPGSIVSLPPSFFALATPLERVRRMHELIVAAHPDISPGLRSHYVDACDQIRLHRGLGP